MENSVIAEEYFIVIRLLHNHCKTDTFVQLHSCFDKTEIAVIGLKTAYYHPFINSSLPILLK